MKGTENLAAVAHFLSHSVAMVNLMLACSLRFHCESPSVGAGETWQAALDDGSEVYFEQISHHPPVSAFQLIGPGTAHCPDGVDCIVASLPCTLHGSPISRT